MDPHSRLSQFNHRGPKAGPAPISHFTSEMHSKPHLDTFASMQNQSSSKSATKKKSASKSPFSSSVLLVRRPIATNSRIKRDESYRIDMYLAFVNNALQQKLNGNSEPFDELVNQFNPKQHSEPLYTDTSTSLRTWILALTHVVSRLERTHSTLVEAIVNMPWTTLDSATVKSYTIFIGMLLSARPEYLSLVLGRIAQGFTYQSGMQTLNQAFPESSSSPITRRVIYDRLHYSLQHLLSLIPTLPSTLQPLLVRSFPHKRQSQLAQSTYIRNLLRISSYCPELSEKILATIIDRAIQIDVEIQVELEEVENEEPLEEQPLFEIDPFDVLLGQEEPDSSDLSEIDDSDVEGDDFSDLSSDTPDVDDDDNKGLEIPTNLKHIQDMVKKLDSILTLVFEHFKRMHTAVSFTVGSAPANGSTSASRPPSPPELPKLPPLSSPLPSNTPFTSPLTPPSSSTPVSRFPEPNKPIEGIPDSSQPPSAADDLINRRAHMDIMRTHFNTLLAIFDRTILRTFKSRYTQFLIFWYTSLETEFADIFQGMLVERALLGSSPTPLIPTGTYPHSQTPSDLEDGSLDSQSPGIEGASTINRAAAASYIGSFVSRATFVDAEGTRRVVAVLCEFLRAHLDEVEEPIRTLSSMPVVVGGSQHTVFYAVTQAVFLIFCFRWRDLMKADEEENEDLAEVDHIMTSLTGGKARKWIPELTVLQRVVNSVLNPLRVCSSNVVLQFARVAQATDFIYCYTILESNKRLDNNSGNSHESNNYSNPLRPRNTTAAATPNLFAINRGSASITVELNTFFPFDPYRLPKSAVYIRDVYREWDSVAISTDSDSEEEGEDNDEAKDDLEGKPTPSPEERYLPIPKPKDRSNYAGGKAGAVDEDPSHLGESLGQMSISPRPSGL